MTFDEMKSPKTFLPGIKAKHVIISTACREGRGETGARQEAVSRIDQEIHNLLASWPIEKGATFHLVVTVDREGRSA